MMNVMKRAWEIYRTLTGDHTAKLSMALRMAWKEAKNADNTVAGWDVKALEELGAKRWTKYGKDRLYLSGCGNALVGLEVSYYKSGYISYAAVNGERISNNSAGILMAVYSNAYIDLTTGEIAGVKKCRNHELFDAAIEKYHVA